MAMPWSRAKQIAGALRGRNDFPDNYRGSRTILELTTLFDACFRIQREACEAAGRHIPLIVENVRGAQPWVGRARWNFGSFYLYGDVPALMPMTMKRQVMKEGIVHRPNGETNFHGLKVPGNNGPRMWSEREVQRLCDATKGIPHRPTGHWTNPDENGTKQGGDWFNAEQPSISRLTGSKSNVRKAASAQIARIPFPLARYIAQVFKPVANG